MSQFNLCKLVIAILLVETKLRKCLVSTHVVLSHSTETDVYLIAVYRITERKISEKLFITFYILSHFYLFIILLFIILLINKNMAEDMSTISWNTKHVAEWLGLNGFSEEIQKRFVGKII